MTTSTNAGVRVSGDQILAVLSGSFVGAILLGLVLQAGLGRGGIRQFGALVGQRNYGASWAVLFVLSTLLAVLFVAFVSRSMNSFVNRVIMLSSRNDMLRTALVPLLERSALTVTTNALGTIYGFVVWLVFYALFVPAWLSFVVGIEDVTLPNLHLAGLLAWLLYGGLIGLLYGLILEA